MFDLFFPSRYSYSPKKSMQYEKDLINLALGIGSSSSSGTPTNFPKHNVYRLLDGSPYRFFVEFALAGYSKESISAKMDGGYLVVSSKKSEQDKSDEAGREYLSRGMARRDFTTTYFVGKDVEVRSAKFANGLLTIELERMVPEEKKPRPIDIS